MTRKQIEVSGTLHADGTLVLDQKPDLPPGRVRVIVEPVAPSAAQAESLTAFVSRVRRESEARGHRFMTDEEVTAWMEDLRGEDDRIEQAYRAAEER